MTIDTTCTEGRAVGALEDAKTAIRDVIRLHHNFAADEDAEDTEVQRHEAKIARWREVLEKVDDVHLDAVRSASFATGDGK